MSDQIRIFSRDELEAMGIPDLAQKGPGKAVELHREKIEQRRWVSVNSLAFRAPDDGRVWRVEYLEGLTEDQDDTDPWDYVNTVRAEEVWPFQVNHTAWMTPTEAALYPQPITSITDPVFRAYP